MTLALTLQFDRPQTPAEAQLRAWAEAQPALSYPQIHGALHGVIASSMNGKDLERSALRLLRLEAPDDIHALAVQAARELQALQGGDTDEIDSLTMPRFVDHPTFLEWMSGISIAALSQPAVMMQALATQMELTLQAKKNKMKREETKAIKEMTDALLFLMAMTPEEFYPSSVHEELIAAFKKLRSEHTQPEAAQEWDEEGRQKVALDVLNAVYVAYLMESFAEGIKMDDLLSGSLGRPLPTRRAAPKVGPNQPCPCGSGKKYKKCHGAPNAAALPSKA